MSKDFVIESTDSSPYCEISLSDKSILLSGVSMPENANEFYFPIIEKVNQLFEGGTGIFSFIIDFSYMNSMSNKQILRLIKHIESKGFSIVVYWKYNADDELMRVKGDELKRICKTITFNVEQSN